MATEKEIQLVCDIQRIGIQINMQGKYHSFIEFSGHVSCIYVYLRHADSAENVNEFAEFDQHVYLSTRYKNSPGERMKDVFADKVEQLEKLKAAILVFLDRDEDGVPI